MQGDTGHAQSRMVTDLYAHTNNEERRRLAEKVETDFFQKRADTPQEKPLDNTAERAYRLLLENPDIAKLIIATLQNRHSTSLLENLLESPTKLRNDKIKQTL